MSEAADRGEALNISGKKVVCGRRRNRHRAHRLAVEEK